jgi:hypothetical protein
MPMYRSRDFSAYGLEMTLRLSDYHAPLYHNFPPHSISLKHRLLFVTNVTNFRVKFHLPERSVQSYTRTKVGQFDNEQPRPGRIISLSRAEGPLWAVYRLLLQF